MLNNPEIKRYLPAVLITVACVAVFIFINWLISPKFDSYFIQKTPFTTDSFPTLRGTDIYAYSGNSFYRTNIADENTVTVLSKGARLPAIRDLQWAGDEGALLVFDGTQTDSSILEDALTKKGLTINNTTLDFVWYLRFDDNSLHLISEDPLVTKSYYAEGEKVIYFSTLNTNAPVDLESENIDATFPLWAFDTQKLSNKKIISNIGPEQVHYIGPCPAGKICAIQENEGDKQTLWTIDHNKKKTILEYDTLSATNNPNIFFGEKRHPFIDKLDENHSSEDEELQMDTYTINLLTKEQTATGVTVNYGADVSVTMGANDKSFALMDTSFAQRNYPTYLAVAPDIFGKLKTKQIFFKTADSADDFSETISSRISVNREGVSLMEGSNNETYIVSRDGKKLNFAQYDDGQIGSTLKTCFDKYTKYHQYTSSINTMTVGIQYDDKFKDRISNFSNCIEKTDKNAFVGQNYIFHGVSPIDGRLVTN